MKTIADWIRDQTPEWTDTKRFKTLSIFHTILEPVCIIGFIFSNYIIRVLILLVQLTTVTTQLSLRECLLTLIEKEFEEKSNHDIFLLLFQSIGWNITRSEKMTFNIGLNIGVLIVFLLMILKESVLWMSWIVALIIIALPTLMYFSKFLLNLQNEKSHPDQIPVESEQQTSSHTLPHVFE
jgi:hypothetical protein